MDRRSCLNHEAGFDVCDPVGSVLNWSGSCPPARVLRRRCRSEGIERVPCDDALGAPHRAGSPHHFGAYNRSQFTLNCSPERYYPRFLQECLLPATQNGDYLMAHEQHRNRFSHSGKSKYRASPTRPLVVSSRVENSGHLPKVQELLERVDQEMVEAAAVKQPLKSILNNPLPKSPPQGILKKPKCKLYQDTKLSVEGRRRQRAASESDNLYCNYHYGSTIPGYESRISSMKRVKDNSGTGYSYGSAFASLTLPSKPSPNYTRPIRCTCKPDNTPVRSMNREEIREVHILRTTAINSDTQNETHNPYFEVHDQRSHSPSPTCPAVSPALPVSSDTTIPVAKKTVKVKRKIKKPTHVKSKDGCKMAQHASEAEDECSSRSPSPPVKFVDDVREMETDALIAEIEKLEAPCPSPKPPHTHEDICSVAKLSNKLNGTVVSSKKVPSIESPLIIPELITSCLRMSLFPRVPPYLRFVAHDEATPLKIPAAIQKHLKWKLTTITPIVVKKTLMNSGFKLLKSECDTSECPQEETIDWIGTWGKHMKSLMFRAIKDGQKMNHFPGTFQIGRKDRLWRNLQKLVVKYGIEEFGIMPKTYVLPHDLKLLKHDWEKYAANNEKWIIKPPASARGTGIKVVSKWVQIPKKRPVVVQRYVSKPYLINGSKFDMRLYVLMTSVHPLRIYLYKDGLARFASVKYSDELGSLNDRYMHLTNYSINRLSKNYTPNEDFEACQGHKWTLQSLFQYLKTEKNVDIDALWDSMKDLVIKTIISGESSISSLTKANITSRYNCYELFGIDVLLDEDLKPWLLEVNISPSLHSASPLDIHVKGPLVSSVLNIAQFQVPLRTNLEMLCKQKPNKLAGLPYDSRLYTVYLSKEERDKHIIYTNMEDRDMYLRDILSTLTSDDVRHLIQAEDELTQAGDMERIFPTRETHRYLNFLAGPRYYNRLFDAWETRYGDNRETGVELLGNLCDIGYHLEVPPVPLKNDVDAPSPPPSERPSVPSVTSVELCGATGLSLSGAASSTLEGLGTPGGRLCGEALHSRAVGVSLEPRA